MTHPLVLSWPLMMTIMVVYVLRSPIHTLLVAELMNSGRDVIVLVVAEVKSTTLMLQHQLSSLQLVVHQLQHLLSSLQLVVHQLQDLL